VSEIQSKAADDHRLRKYLKLGLFVPVTILFAVLLLLPRHEPLYNGKPVSYWVDQAVDLHSRSQGDSILQVYQIGPPAVPYLILKLRTKDTWIRETWRVLLTKLPPILRNRFRPVPDAQSIRTEAAYILTKFGPQAKGAVPDLAKMLAGKGWEACTAARILGAIGPGASTAIPAWKQAMAKTDLLSEVEMAAAIWKIDRETNLVIQILEQAIVLQPQGNGLNAMNALAEMGPAAAPTVPLLTKVLMDKTHRSVGDGNAACALGEIGCESDAVVAALMDGSQDLHWNVRGNSFMALWRLDSRRYAAIAAPNVIRMAAIDLNWDSFLKFAEKNHLEIEPAIPTLQELLNDDSPEVRKLAGDALRELNQSAIKKQTKKDFR
jgi:HEAT repeat protein